MTNCTDAKSAILLDANIVLNASFLSNGQCAQALRILAQRGATLRVDDFVWLECERRIQRILRSPVRAAAAIAHMKIALSGLPVIHVPPAAWPTNTPHHDGHIIAYATTHRLPVLTADNELQAKLLKQGAKVVTPDGPLVWDCISRRRLPPWADPAPGDLRAQSVVVVARTGAWAGLPTGTIHTLLSAKGWGRLAVHNTARKPAVRFDGPLGSVKVPFSVGDVITVLLTTEECLSTRLTGRCALAMTLGVGHPRGPFQRGQAKCVPILPCDALLSIGSEQDQGRVENFWNGNLVSITSVPFWMSPSLWKLVCTVPGFQPSFCADAGLLENALCLGFS